MKNILYKNISLICLLALMGTSCRSFEDINTNRQEVTPEMAERDGVSSGGVIQSMQRSVVPVGTSADKTDIINAYQTAYHIGQDTWSGYFGENADWNSGRNSYTYSLVEDWVKATYQQSYVNVFDSWLKIKNDPVSKKHPENFALAQILKISTWHKATDCFGPIPYLKAGEGLYVTPYDAQDVVYKTMLNELKEAVDVLTDYYHQGGKLFSDFDMIYNGDTEKWIKYANSLMLRLAMRVVYADEALAKKYAEMAVKHEIGVMKTADDGASISFAHGLQFENPIERFAGQYKEARMGSTAFSYLAGYHDPRLSHYYKPSEHVQALRVAGTSDKYLPIPTGLLKREGESEGKNTLYYCSLPNIERTTPVHWLLASEVYFLRAEGALRGFDMLESDPETLYKEGIKVSFEENKIDPSLAASYAENNTLKPVGVAFNGVGGVNGEIAAPTKATIKLEGNMEQKLEKIMIQKWIALYPNGQEAWSEWRRTGYPRLHMAIHNTNPLIRTEDGIRRMFYSYKIRVGQDLDNYNKMLPLLGGDDVASTKVWWDKKR